MPETPSQPDTELSCLLGCTVLIASETMREVMRLTRRIARSEAAVLITGETGVGKDLIESELFGYEKGAFSGAGTGKPGLFELAHSGSLFLDEIGELEPRVQVKLLRVLDGAPYYRLGGTRKVAVDTRVIAATNANLEEAVRRGAFRAKHWSDQLAKTSASFDEKLFNGEYYSLWVDGKIRDELCMTDQISGEWFTSLIGLPATTSKDNLNHAVQSIFKYNFNPEFGLHNATAPKRGADLLALNNLQAGGLWSGIEFAFASFLMDHGRYADGVKIVEAIHRRYMRAGQPWNHVECGGHYSRAMSSWADRKSVV